MRPSRVRSNTAPQASSSLTRSGASLAWSSAIFQLFRYCPPLMVSAKWTRQLSRLSTLPIAAAIPPSAITVCALPSSDLHTSPTFAPCAAASIAARKPAPPAPMTSTSCSIVWYSMVIGRSSGRAPLENPPVVPDTHRAHPDVQVGERDPDEAHPRPLHMPAVETARAV